MPGGRGSPDVHRGRGSPDIHRSASVPSRTRFPVIDHASTVASAAQLATERWRTESPTQGMGLSSWPSRVTQPRTQWECKAPALEEIEAFILKELSRVPRAQQDKGSRPRDGALKLQVYREAFDLFIGHFGTYAAPLTAIKRAYDDHIGELRRAAAVAASDHGDDSAKLLALSDATIAGLRTEVRNKEVQLSSALRQLRELQEASVADLEEEQMSPAWGPVSKGASALVDDGARSASLDHLKAWGSPTHPRGTARVARRLAEVATARLGPPQG